MAGWEHEPRIVIHDDPPPVPLGSGAKRARLRATARALAAGVGWLWSGLRFAALGLGPLAVLAFVVWVVVGEVRSQRVEIAPIAVPAQFAALGFTPEIMARRLLDQITTIQRRATTTMSRSEAALAGESADFALPGVGLSLSAVVQTLRTALGLPSARVTGEITLEGGSPTLRLRLAGQGPVSEVGAPWIDSMDGLLHEAAKSI